MDRAPAPEPLRLVQTFVNTLDVESAPSPQEIADSMRAWLAEHGVAGATASEVARAVEFRDLVRRMLQHDGCVAHDREIRETVNRISGAAPLRVQFHEDGLIALEPAEQGFDAALGNIVGAIFESMADGTWSRLKLCRMENCRWVYYDSSRNSSGNWCSMSVCGNRAKARAYRRRVKSEE